jgi:hypothetical protein
VFYTLVVTWRQLGPRWSKIHICMPV